jgi:hypothetical protein
MVDRACDCGTRWRGGLFLTSLAEGLAWGADFDVNLSAWGQRSTDDLAWELTTCLVLRLTTEPREAGFLTLVSHDVRRFRPGASACWGWA